MPLDALQVTDAWVQPIAQTWEPGEHAAQQRLTHFVDDIAAGYATERDRPDRDGTSRLSPHLAWGEISVHAIWRQLTRTLGDTALPFLREIAWRDFNMHLLHDFPELTWQPMQAKFAAFPAMDHPRMLQAWQRGLTGYPIVDAGMRQLWRTGWMHNRVRMIVASFLVKDLLIPWQRGEEWFWDTLVDADPAQNGGNWQWVAGCGADAAPFFRVFNPVLQGGKFDPKGCYVREWAPELAKLSDAAIHQPWTAPTAQLSAAGVTLGKNYPLPIVDHAKARLAALAAYQRISARVPERSRNHPCSETSRAARIGETHHANAQEYVNITKLRAPGRYALYGPSARGYDYGTIIASQFLTVCALGGSALHRLSFPSGNAAPFAGVIR